MPRSATGPATLSAAQLLFSQGFGTRRDCAAVVAARMLGVDDAVVDDPAQQILVWPGRPFSVQGQPWQYHERALLMLHKPAGYECSRKPRHHPSVLSLLPGPLRTRDVQPIGRLDEDTTGLLLLTDDGALIHRLTSPRHHVPKVYEVQTKHPLDPRQLQALLEGVVLHEESVTVKAAAAEILSAQHLRLTLEEGKYHQVKRMVAAAGNRVEGLHRSRFGALALPDSLRPGQWVWVEASQIDGSVAAPAAK